MPTINGRACVVNGTPVDKVFSDGRQVYGRNYFLNSDFSQAETNWNDPNNVWFLSGEKCNGQKVMTATPTVAWMIGAQNSFSQTKSAIANQQVTVSVWAKSIPSGAKFHSEPNGGYGAFNTSLTSTWKRYSYVTQTNTIGAIHFMAVDVGTHYWISMPQVEIGNKVTDWTPAPEDISIAVRFNIPKTLMVGSTITLRYEEYPLGIVPIGNEPSGMFGGGNKQNLSAKVISMSNGSSVVEVAGNVIEVPSFVDGDTFTVQPDGTYALFSGYKALYY